MVVVVVVVDEWVIVEMQTHTHKGAKRKLVGWWVGGTRSI
jgi:hypothetical protein